MPRSPNLADWRAVVPDVNPEEIAILGQIDIVEPHDVLGAEEAVRLLRLGIRIGRELTEERAT